MGIKVLQTADWHIGSFKGPEKDGVNLRSEDTMKCLREIVRVAHEEKPDLVLVSGDIFHQAEVWQGRSHREVLQAREIILGLSEAAGRVIVMRGTPNHDSEEAFEELKAHFDFVPNVDVVTTPGVIRTRYFDVAVVPGFDKGTFRAAHPGISKEEENIVFSDELGNIVSGMKTMCDSGKASILMSHYTVPGCNTESGQTQFLTQFEPVITQDMLISAEYDLVALGHIHRPQSIPGLKNVYYSGAVNAMNFNDENQKRGFWIHEFSFDVVNNRALYKTSVFHETPYREFATFHLTDMDITAINTGILEVVAFNHWKYNGGAADKIVRVLYTCSAEQKKIFNAVPLEKALYEAGAFYVAGIEAEKIESANRAELSKQEDPETNLVQYLQEKLIDPEQIDSIVEKARPIIATAKANSSVSEFFGTFVPKEITVKNYRNYVEQYFSFEDISFCTINGQNGSGKSSLFMDAIVDCLYEEPREGINTGWIRNDDKARSGSISFTFGLGDKTFRVVRTRTKSGKPTLNLSELLDGAWVDRSKEKIADTQKEIIRILGMDSLTFKACVLIMQDQYGIFLEAGKEERVGVLSNLLGLGIYGIMENLTRDQLGMLKREIAKKHQTINVHSNTIAGYGNPKQEKADVEYKLREAQKKQEDLTKQKEDKSLLLRMQQEAEARHRKVQTSVNALMQKKAATEQNIALHESTISNCVASLASEAETVLKAARHAELVEMDRDLARAAVSYAAKHEELIRVHNQESREESDIKRMQMEADAKRNEINSLILESANDGEVRRKAAEYEQKKKILDEMQEKAVAYQKAKNEYSAAVFHQDEVLRQFESELKSAEEQKKVLEKKVAILEESGCVDIDNAHCRFLQDAIEAKEQLALMNSVFIDIDSRKQCEAAKAKFLVEEKSAALENIGFDAVRLSAIQIECASLKPYVAQLESISQRESQIALFRASFNNIQSNISEAEKRLSEAKLKGTELKQDMLALQDKVDRHRAVSQEMLDLSRYVEKSNTYPVIKERKKNAESQKADEVLRMAEIERDLSEAQKELAETTGATVDITQLMADIVSINENLDTITRTITRYQQMIGSLAQKIEEIEKMTTEVKALQKEAGRLSVDISEYDLLKAAFSQDGIPHQIIRSLVPKLTEISSSILSQMTGGKMGIEFRTEKVMKSNTNKEVVTLDIFIEEYGKSTLPYLSKSGGEKVKASLSVILALAEIKSSTAGIQLGMLFIDEPPFLDSDGIQAYCDALETIQRRYPDLKIMAITHDPTMKARFPQSLDVVKTSEGSRVIY
jgi:exonuclease SbcC